MILQRAYGPWVDKGTAKYNKNAQFAAISTVIGVVAAILGASPTGKSYEYKETFTFYKYSNYTGFINSYTRIRASLT